MDIEIKNCNNIDSATVSIIPNKINIKYGMNGTGKSTIAKAIEMKISGKDLDSLMPFKYLKENSDNIKPNVEGLNSFKECLTFNESYVDRIVFNEEVIDNSFEIFIKNDSYKENEKYINDFLSRAGYKYNVFTDENKMFLRHEDLNQKIEHASNHLSFGEKNAFALILFLCQSESEKSDFIILDDPVSSFDGDKKFTIINCLFKNGNDKRSLKGKTVLFLTHDLEPLIDMKKVLYRRDFERYVSCNFLQIKNRYLNEIEIGASDIKYFGEICNEKILSNEVDLIIKIIYLRRFNELSNNRGIDYNILSEFLHKMELKDVLSKMTNPLGDFKLSIDLFYKYLKNISNQLNIEEDIFHLYLDKIKNKEYMIDLYNNVDSNYEKLQVARVFLMETELYNKIKKEDVVLKKFLDETCHIENDLIMQLDPVKYDCVRDDVIEQLNAYILT